MRLSSRWVIVSLVILMAAAALSVPITSRLRENHDLPLTGQVIDTSGLPVGDATITSGRATATTDASGSFQMSGQGDAAWVTASHPRFVSRTRAAAPGDPVLIRLTPDDGEVVSLHFAGDVMFGRRFYDPNEDGDPSDGLLRPGADVGAHLRLLDDVRPMLANADISVVNLETPLVSDPYFDPTEARPARFHPTSNYIIASDRAAAAALSQAGVDVVDLANNHLYDVQEEGIASTILALDAAGVRHFGAGTTEEAAWEPVVLSVDGRSIAFIGCTTIFGESQQVKYTASDPDNKGGSARCDEKVIRAKVGAAKANSDTVVFMIHGGVEYQRSPAPNVEKMSAAAREAGATLIINHHPHVVGGVDWNGDSLVAWSMGNFLFDQTVWPSFESYLLNVDLHLGQVSRAYTEPLLIEGYTPAGVTGGLANYVAREAAGREPGPFVMEDGAMEVDIGGVARQRDQVTEMDGGRVPGTVYRLNEGGWASGFAGPGDLRLGRDLLWTGSFEDEAADRRRAGGSLWTLRETGANVLEDAAFDGSYGARLERRDDNTADVVLTPIHRVLVDSGAELSVTGMMRAPADADLSLQLSWYPDTTGPSVTQTIVPLRGTAGGGWTPIRVDVTVPPNVVAVGLYLRLAPPRSGQTRADVDDLRLIEWAPADAAFSPLYDHVKLVGQGSLTVASATLPGGEQWVDLDPPVALTSPSQMVSNSTPGTTRPREESPVAPATPIATPGEDREGRED